MFYYFQDKLKLPEGKLEFKEHKYMFNSYEMELYSVGDGPGSHWMSFNGRVAESSRVPHRSLGIDSQPSGIDSLAPLTPTNSGSAFHPNNDECRWMFPKLSTNRKKERTRKAKGVGADFMS
jgi:hypothetical protein